MESTATVSSRRMEKDMLPRPTRYEIPTLVRAELVQRDVATRVGVSMDTVRASAPTLHASMMPQSGRSTHWRRSVAAPVRRSESPVPSPTIPIGRSRKSYVTQRRPTTQARKDPSVHFVAECAVSSHDSRNRFER
jgi:hypothetical protein